MEAARRQRPNAATVPARPAIAPSFQPTEFPDIVPRTVHRGRDARGPEIPENHRAAFNFSNRRPRVVPLLYCCLPYRLSAPNSAILPMSLLPLSKGMNGAVVMTESSPVGPHPVALSWISDASNTEDAIVLYGDVLCSYGRSVHMYTYVLPFLSIELGKRCSNARFDLPFYRFERCDAGSFVIDGHARPGVPRVCLCALCGRPLRVGTVRNDRNPHGRDAGPVVQPGA